MVIFFEKIKSLSRFELINFFNLVFFDREELGLPILKRIKVLKEEEQNIIIKIFKTITDISWMTEELKVMPSPDEKELIEIDNVIEEIFMDILPQVNEEVQKNSALLKKQIIDNREFLKAELTPFYLTDQMAGVEFPPVQKAIADNSMLIALPKFDKQTLKKNDLFDCIKDRESHRTYKAEALSLEELSFLLWATQGVRQKFNNDKQTRRTVPSGGSRHPFETYLAVNNVEGIKPGIYRYLPMEHNLVFLHEVENQIDTLKKHAYEQNFVGECAVTFIWSAIPYRTEWRYGLLSKKDILLDCGHVCQNLYLACEAISCGTCAIGAYKQREFDEMLKLDGKEEFTVYLAPVGKVC